MTAPAILDAAIADDDAFVDALVGLDRLCGWLGAAIDRAIVEGELPGELVDDASDDLLDALLGVVSARTTLSLVLSALASEPVDGVEDPAASWSLGVSRELLR
jgi:hypothetical protein